VDPSDELVRLIADRLEISRTSARDLAEAAEPLWSELADFGMVDSFDGAECRRVLPAALDFIHGQARAGPGPT
jgi:hypothetical protein